MTPDLAGGLPSGGTAVDKQILSRNPVKSKKTQGERLHIET